MGNPRTRRVIIAREVVEKLLTTGNRAHPVVIEAGIPQGSTLVWANFNYAPGYLELLFEHESFPESGTDLDLLDIRIAVTAEVAG